MDNIFVLNPKASENDIKNAIQHRLSKLRSITTSLMSGSYQNSVMDFAMFYGVLWTMDDFLEELELLNDKLYA